MFWIALVRTKIHCYFESHSSKRFSHLTFNLLVFNNCNYYGLSRIQIKWFKSLRGQACGNNPSCCQPGWRNGHINGLLYFPHFGYHFYLKKELRLRNGDPEGMYLQKGLQQKEILIMLLLFFLPCMQVYRLSQCSKVSQSYNIIYCEELSSISARIKDDRTIKRRLAR